jgi:rhodanese-related sulfurtransferase
MMGNLARLTAAFTLLAATPALAQSAFDAALGEANEKTADLSTAELKRILIAGSATLLDARPPKEFAVSHIPGAVNVAPQPGRPAHLYVSDIAEVARFLAGDKARPLVLYCNGPFCGKSKRLAADLIAAGHIDVRRYQIGAPGWRALAGAAMQTELSALRYIGGDRTAVWIDAREASDFARGTIGSARNVPVSGLRPGKDQGVLKAAKDDGRLPMDDHNTRIVVFGANGKDARAVADAIAGEAFHNVSFVAEPIDQVRRALRERR